MSAQGPPKRELQGAQRERAPAGASRRQPITGVVLAGGLGRRMGSVDKGLVELAGKPMVAHVLERFVPQVHEVLINANRSIDAYAAFGHRVIPDRVAGFAGPLAGLHAALSEASCGWVATVPCDSPFLPRDLVERLRAACVPGTQLAAARTFDQPHPVFALVRRDVLPHLDAFLQAGGRKIDAWYATLASVEVAFDDEADAFRNINSAEELAAAAPGLAP